jgi:hypothetical protein
MTRALLAFVLFLTACGAERPAPFVPAAECVTDGGIRFELQTARDCSFYNYTGFLLGAELGDGEPGRVDWTPPFPAREVDHLLNGLVVYVHDGIQFACEDGDVVTGCQWWGNPTPTIEVSETAGALVHEGFHLWQERAGVAYSSSYNHEGWADAGWMPEADLVYWFLDAQFHARFGGTSPDLADGGAYVDAPPPGLPSFPEFQGR